MKIAYFDCFSGISGDMCLGALVDAGIPLNEIEKRLKKLPVRGYRLTEKKVKRAGIAATKVDVNLKSAISGRQSVVRRWKDIKKIIKTSTLSDDVKKKGYEIFKRIFEAEARVHGMSIDRVHLHELSGTDSLVDIFGTLTGLELLGFERIYSSPINLGSGFVNTAHGVLPVPAPATAELLKGVPVYSSGIPSELTTPTGAAIIKTLSAGFGEMPFFIPDHIGLGAGSRDFKDRPNVLRVLIGNSSSPPFGKGGMGGFSNETITVIETNIDDMNPQIYEYIIERLFKEGALDVYLTQIIMKKTRPGIKMSVLCNSDKRDNLINLIFKETTTIGVRCYETNRVTMKRETKYVETKYGKVRVKYSVFGNSVSKSAPEYEDCRKLAKEKGIPLISVIDEAKKACRGIALSSNTI